MRAMQIIVPMSGFGERFRRAGHRLPKPLIEVDGKPTIAHVVGMFDADCEFVFVCNQDHLADPAYLIDRAFKLKRDSAASQYLDAELPLLMAAAGNDANLREVHLG